MRLCWPASVDRGHRRGSPSATTRWTAIVTAASGGIGWKGNGGAPSAVIASEGTGTDRSPPATLPPRGEPRYLSPLEVRDHVGRGVCERRARLVDVVQDGNLDTLPRPAERTR